MIKLLLLTTLTVGFLTSITGCQSVPYFKSFAFAAVNYDSEEMFNIAVKPSLEMRCIQCHSNSVANGGLNLQDKDSIYRDNPDGAFIVPGNPDSSRIWQAIVLPDKHRKSMPADGWGLSDDELRFFLTWIKKGAHWPEGRAGELKYEDFDIGS